MTSAKVVLDSISPLGVRLVTLELVYHRFIHAELLTHRLLSRSAASSRAIPVNKMIQRVREDTAIPVYWGKNQRGMQAHEELSPEDQEKARAWWLRGAEAACSHAEEGVALGLHKQVVNRVLEPFSHIVTLVTATEWDNFIHLRTHTDAQPEMRVLAQAIHAELQRSKPLPVGWGEWHLPYASQPFLPLHKRKAISAARCARISYLTHDGRTSTWEEDESLAGLLKRERHMGPFEHQATPDFRPESWANFSGWRQQRRDMPNEHGRSD